MALSRGPADVAALHKHGLGAKDASWLGTKPADEGERMPPAVQGKMQRSFGFDFSAVRIHRDDRARSVGARAFAQGTDLHFAPGEYAPESRAGQAVLGHELGHVVQQAAGRVRAPAQAFGGAINDDPALEREADQMGESASAGKPVDKKPREKSDANESLQNRFASVMGGKSEGQPIQRKVEVHADTKLPSFDKYLNKAGNVYSYGSVDRTKGNLGYEIFTSLFNSPRTLKLQGSTSADAEHFLMRHIAARQGVVEFASKKQYKFTGARSNFHMNPKYWSWNKGAGTYASLEADPVEASKDLNVNPKEYTIGCEAATRLTVQGGGESRRILGTTADDHDWVPGESGYIKNEKWVDKVDKPGLEGENIIYMGGKEFWGHFRHDVAIKPYIQWFLDVDDWNHGGAKLQPDREWPSKGLEQ